jgi:hypothetical protein
MKKLLAILFMALSTQAFADAVGIEVGEVNVQNGMAHQTYAAFAYRKDINQMVSLDVATAGLRTDDAMGRPSDAASVRVETGATFRLGRIGSLGLYDRVALGNQFGSWTNMKTRSSANQDFTYWSNELGVMTSFGKVDARLGYRWRNTNGADRGFKTETTRLNVGYNVDKQNRFGIGYDALRGDFKANQVALTYTRSF